MGVSLHWGGQGEGGSGRGGDQEFEKVLQDLVNEGVEARVRVQSQLGEELHAPYLHQRPGSDIILQNMHVHYTCMNSKRKVPTILHYTLQYPTPLHTSES